MKSKRTSLFVSSLCLLGIAGFFPCSSSASQDSGSDRPLERAVVKSLLRQSVKLDADVLKDFHKAFQALAERHKVAFVIEGTPVDTVIPLDKPVVLPPNASLSEAVNLLANAFDFDAEFKGNTFVLIKRYSDPRDLPSVTLDECSLAVADIMRAYKAYRPVLLPSPGSFSPSPRVGPTVQSLFESLSREQVEALNGGTLAISSLTPSQRNSAQQFARYLYVETAYSSLDSVASEFENLDKTHIAMGADARGSGKRFGYGYPSRDGRPVFVAFDPYNSRSPVSAAQKVASAKSNGAGGQRLLPPSPCTIEELVLRLNKRSQVPISTDESMRAKTILLIGEEHATPAQLVTAVSNIFDARVVNNKEKGLSIIRRRNPLPGDISGLSAFVVNTIPVPLLRALHYGAAAPVRPPLGVDAQSTNPSLSSRQVGEAYRAYRSTARQWEGRFRNLPVALRAEAGRQLLFLTEAGIKNNEKKPIADLADAEKNLFAVALMGRLLSDISTNLNTAPPRYITGFDALNLQGRIEEANGRRELSVYFSIPFPGQEFKPGLGVVGGGSTVLEAH